jgi:hypothetical protein
VFAGNWAKEMNDWVPMREQYCAQRVVGQWLALPEDVLRTKMSPFGERVGPFGKET